ncbi:MAG: DUF1090 family protein [Acidovorax sp.]|nr:DUF1090 family protein [Acidovorax sp.]MDP3229324.1 DUF1090 family protein [Acidovorax sp.]
MHASSSRFAVAIAIAMAWATSSVSAQPANTAATANTAQTADANMACNAEKAELERRVELARSKGQMLQRKQLADQLAALAASCKPMSADQTRRIADMERLDKKISALKAELATAEEQLRKLKSDERR